MVYKIFVGNEKIVLPNEYTIEERINYCIELVSKYEEYFTYEISSSKVRNGSASEKVKLRLDILGQYIYDASIDSIHNDNIITPDRRRRNNKREIVFSDIERNTNE